MKLYHGTSERYLKSILAHGLRPRGAGGKSNWTHSIESNPNTVYLTTSYGLYFALAAVKPSKLGFDRAVILEIDTDNLDPALMVADEDALEQIDRGMRQISRDEMIERTRLFRDQVENFRANGYGWEWSIGKLGTCGYQGVISRDQISRAALIDMQKSPELAFAFYDATLSVMNNLFLGKRNLAIHRSIFGDPHDYDMQYNGFFPLPSLGEGIQIINVTEDTHGLV